MLPLDITTIRTIAMPLVEEAEGLLARLTPDAGKRNQWNIGFGHGCDALEVEYWTGKTMRGDTARRMLEHDLWVASSECGRVLNSEGRGVYRDCAVVELMFALGLPVFLDFVEFRGAWGAGEMDRAGYEVLDSAAAWGRLGGAGWGRARSCRLAHMVMFDGLKL